MISKLEITPREFFLLGLFTVVLLAAVHAMAPLPNIEPVTLLLMLYTLIFKEKVIYILSVYLFTEGIFYGFGLWWVMYLYVWGILVLVTYIHRRQHSVLVFAVIAGMFGLCFGALCSIVYLFAGGVHMAFKWWVAGIPYDLIHSVSNFVLCLILFPALRKLFGRVVQMA